MCPGVRNGVERVIRNHRAQRMAHQNDPMVDTLVVYGAGDVEGGLLDGGTELVELTDGVR